MIDRLRREGSFLPVLTLVASLMVIWYAGAVYLNSTQLIDRYQKQDINWNLGRLAADAWRMERPVLPSPHQVAVELKKTVLDKPVTSKRSLLYHAGITLSSSLLGFALGTLLGVALAIGIVYVTTLDRSLMPWIIASQTVPILALAPMIIVVLGSVGITGLFPKSVISMYLCFFPVVVGMVKGLRSPEPILIDQMHTYSASPTQVFFKLRLPSSIPFLFTSLKVAIALSVVGAIVAELPTGGQGGLGARLLTGSYYGQITMIWAALIVASVVSALLVTAIGRAERIALRRLNGGQAVTA
ncbi:MAG: ABC transporter permease [Arenicellales bacterium]|nr:MAG: ABC transporter permease [Proteobacteria bacterium TMED61]|tara:strand:- start:128 stop:1024 length:897 start_codon:yes stop_codon:yes gene_type:complete